MLPREAFASPWKDNGFPSTLITAVFMLLAACGGNVSMNSIAFELGQRFGLPFTNHYVHTEVFVNGDYMGSYVLTEQVQTGAGRVDIDEDMGFLVELDVYYDEDPKFTTDVYSLPVMIKTPEDLDDPSGYDFVKTAINGLESALNSSLFPEGGYRNLIDIDTVIDFLQINEITRNREIGWPKSTYMHKDADDKIRMGPIWDFDWGFGYNGEHQHFTTADDLIGKHPFFARFFEDFTAQYAARWGAMREQLDSLPEFINELAIRLQRSYEQNSRRWPEAQNNGPARVVSDLLDWWQARLNYLDLAMGLG